MSTIVKTEGLGRKLGGEIEVTLLADVSIEILSGEFVIVTGPSGSGKSSLLYLLGLLDLPTSGKIWFNGTETSSYRERERADVRLAQLGFVFQFHFLLPEFSALENVMLPMRRLGRLSHSEMKDKAAALLESLGLESQIHKKPKQLSGGQSQRVAIARALANDPLLILADEPTGNLDTASSDMVRDILKEITEAEHRSVVTVTHDMHFAKNPDRLIRIVDGKVAPS